MIPFSFVASPLDSSAVAADAPPLGPSAVGAGAGAIAFCRPAQALSLLTPRLSAPRPSAWAQAQASTLLPLPPGSVALARCTASPLDSSAVAADVPPLGSSAGWRRRFCRPAQALSLRFGPPHDRSGTWMGHACRGSHWRYLNCCALSCFHRIAPTASSTQMICLLACRGKFSFLSDAACFS